MRSSQLYHAQPAAIIEVIRSVGAAAKRVMIVGHNPGLEDVITQLTGEHIGLATATLVHVDAHIKRWADLELSREATLRDSWHPDEM